MNVFLSLNQTLMTFLVLERLTWRNQLILTISLPLFSFNPKGFCYSYAWSCSLWEGRNSFCMGLISGKLYGFLLIFLNAFTSFSVLLLFHLLITFFIFMHDSDATHSVHPPPLFFWRGRDELNLLPNFQKGGAWQDFNFERGLLEKRG